MPADSPLRNLEEVVVTPYFAAGTVDSYEDVAGLVRENVRVLA